MARKSQHLLRLGRAVLAMLAIASLLAPPPAISWGSSAQRLVISHAIETLPAEMRPFFEANRDFLVKHVDDPLTLIDKNPIERNNHFIELDKYGRYPFDQLPRNYQAAIAKYSKSKIEATGLLPWQIGVYSQKLTESLKAGKWEEAKINAAFLAHYVTEANDPFNTTDNFDGKMTNQNGINERFNSIMADRFSSFFPLNPHDASYIPDPTVGAFEMAIESHSQVESLLIADRKARKGLNSYNDEYYDRFYNLTAPILIRQLSEASADVGSYWLTAWINAGRPQLPH